MINRLQAPDYMTAELIYAGGFIDYETYIKAQKLHVRTLEDYNLLLELQALEKKDSTLGSNQK